jgi:hypothetical protein
VVGKAPVLPVVRNKGETETDYYFNSLYVIMIGSASTGTGRCGQKDDSWHCGTPGEGARTGKQGQSRDIAGGDERGAAISDSQCKRARRRGRRRRCRPRRPPPPRARRRRPCRVRPGAAAPALALRGRPHPPAAA